MTHCGGIGNFFIKRCTNTQQAIFFLNKARSGRLFACAIIGVVSSFTIPFFCLAGDFDDNFGVFINPYLSTFESGETYLFSTTSPQTTYLGSGLPSGPYYADLYAGPVGSSTLLGGHYLGNVTSFNVSYAESVGNPENGDLFFAVVYDASKLTQFRAYFTTGGDEPSENYGIISFYYGPETAESSYIRLNYPANGETTASTSVDFGANYWNIDEYTTAGFKITRTDNIFGTIYLESSIFDGQGAISTTTTLEMGAYNYQAYMHAGGDIKYSNESYSFYVLSNPYIGATTTLINTDFACDDLGTIAGAFCSVLVKLFKPAPENIDRFKSLGDLLKMKPPLAYYYAVLGEFGELQASTTPAFVLERAGVDTALTPLRVGVGYAIWVMLGLYVIKRLTRLVTM